MAVIPDRIVIASTARPPTIWPGHFAGTQLQIAGTVTVEGVPARRFVTAHNRSSGDPIRRAVSRADGGFSFRNVPAGTYYIVARDDRRKLEFQAVIADAIGPATMEQN